MNLILRLLVSALAVFILAYFLPGVREVTFGSALIVAIVIGVLNLFVKPILIIFTLPITILTLGLFLLVINACIILLADQFVDGFHVSGFWTALLFSLLLSFLQSLFYSILNGDKK